MKAAMEKAEVTAGYELHRTSATLSKSAMTEITISGVTAKELTWEASGEPT